MLRYYVFIFWLAAIFLNCQHVKNEKNSPDTGSLSHRDSLVSARVLSDTTGIFNFWQSFKNSVLSEDYAMLSAMSYFPFMNHGSFIGKEEFAQIRFPDYIIEDIRKAKPPVKSQMVFEEGVDSKGNIVESVFGRQSQYPIFEVDLNGAVFYFSKMEKEFYFIGLLYGE